MVSLSGFCFDIKQNPFSIICSTCPILGISILIVSVPKASSIQWKTSWDAKLISSGIRGIPSLKALKNLSFYNFYSW